MEIRFGLTQACMHNILLLLTFCLSFCGIPAQCLAHASLTLVTQYTVCWYNEEYNQSYTELCLHISYFIIYIIM